MWDGTFHAEGHAHTYARRLRHTWRKGIGPVALEQAVQLLGRHNRPVHWAGHICDGAWIFMLFLTEDGGALVTYTGVRRVGEESPL